MLHLKLLQINRNLRLRKRDARGGLLAAKRELAIEQMSSEQLQLMTDAFGWALERRLSSIVKQAVTNKVIAKLCADKALELS